jgi:hypothetical protein
MNTGSKLITANTALPYKSYRKPAYEASDKAEAWTAKANESLKSGNFRDAVTHHRQAAIFHGYAAKQARAEGFTDKAEAHEGEAEYHTEQAKNLMGNEKRFRNL